MPPSLPDISQLLESDSQDQRHKAVLLLMRSRLPEAPAILEKVAAQDPSAAIRYLARKALAFLDHGEASLALPPAKAQATHARLAQWLDSPEPARRAEGVRLAVRSGDRELSDRLLQMLSRDPDEAVRAEVLEYAAQFACPSDLPRLLPLLRSPAAALRVRLPAALLCADPAKSLPYLVYLLQDPDSAVRAQARKRLSDRPREELLSALEWMLGQRETWMRDSAVYTLGHVADPQVVPMLRRALGDPSEIVRAKARRGLEKLGANAAPAGTAPASPAQTSATLMSPAPAGPVPAGTAPASATPASSAPMSATPAGTAQADAVLANAVSAGPGPAGPAPAGSAQAGTGLLAEVHPSGVHDPPGQDDPHSGPGGLGDGNPLVRLHVLDEAIHAGTQALLPAILERLHTEENVFVLSRLVVAAGRLGGAQVGKALMPFLDHPELRVVANAIEALDAAGFREARAKVRPLLLHKDPRIRANALMYFRDDSSVNKEDALSKMLASRGFATKLSALHVLSKLHLPGACGLVEQVLGDINDDVREHAFGLLQTWAKAGSADARAMLEGCLDGDVAIKHESLTLRRAPPLRRMAAYALDFGIIVLGTSVAAGAVAAAMPLMLATFGLGLTLALGTFLFFARDGLNAGRGLGKRIMGLRTVDIASNEGCSMAQSLIRQAFLGLGMAGPVELVFLHTDPAGRRMADWLVHTQVVDEKDRPISVGERFFGVVAYGFIGLSVLGSVVGMVTPRERVHRSALFGYTLTLPPGWEFASVQDDNLLARRRTLLRGEEVSVRIQVQRSMHSLEELRRVFQERMQHLGDAPGSPRVRRRRYSGQADASGRGRRPGRDDAGEGRDGSTDAGATPSTQTSRSEGADASEDASAATSAGHGATTTASADLDRLIHAGHSLRESTSRELKDQMPGATFSHGPEGTERRLAGQRVYAFDLYFDLQGHQGMVRGVCLRTGELSVDFLVVSGDRKIFAAREPEIDGLLGSLELH